MTTFEYVMVMVSLVIGLAMTHLLQGLVDIAQRPRPMKLRSIHLVWVGYMILNVAFWWWWQFRLQLLASWTFEIYLFVLAYAAMLYVLSALLFPRVMDPDLDMDQFFYDRRGWFFGVNAAVFAVDLLDSRLKGEAHFASLGLEYVLVTVPCLALCLVAMWTRNRTFHWIFGVGLFVYQLSWALRQFATID